MLELTAKEERFGPKLLVLGIGGGGNNAVARMVESVTQEVELAAVNTDKMVLDTCHAQTKLQIGERLTGGYGAGADPQIGEAAAMENEEEIRELIKAKDMIIITCGMGGGTGTGAAPMIAKFAKEEGVLVVAIVTTPFQFESAPRLIAAQTGVEKLKENVDTLLVIPNDKLLTLSDKPLLLDDAFVMADSVLKYAVEGITNIVFRNGTVNIDFNDLKTTIQGKGLGHLGIGIAEEGDAVIEAVKQAVNSPLLDTTIVGASNILLNVSGKVDIISLNEAASFVRETAGMNVNLIWGTVASAGDEGKIVVTLIATGMPDETKNKDQTTVVMPEAYNYKQMSSIKERNQTSPIRHTQYFSDSKNSSGYKEINHTMTFGNTSREGGLIDIKMPDFLLNTAKK